MADWPPVWLIWIQLHGYVKRINMFTCLVECMPVQQKVSCRVICPPTWWAFSGLFFNIFFYFFTPNCDLNWFLVIIHFFVKIWNFVFLKILIHSIVGTNLNNFLIWIKFYVALCHIYNLNKSFDPNFSFFVIANDKVKVWKDPQEYHQLKIKWAE